MAEQVAFVNGREDAGLAAELYADAAAARLSLQSYAQSADLLPGTLSVWLDPSIDALANWADLTPAWSRYFDQFEGVADVASAAFQAKPDKKVVQTFIDETLSACLAMEPAWLSVPQLPHEDGVGKNKINRALADATARWVQGSGFSGRLILPIILTNRRQSDKKADRTNKIKQVESCFKRSGAHGLWVVDSSLQDQKGSDTFSDRFESLVALHAELKESIVGASPIIGGPYWGLGLVLWVRGLVTYPAISMGSGYRYIIPGVQMRPGAKRIAIPPIRRWAVASPDLRKWLRDSAERVADQEDACSEFLKLESRFTQLSQVSKRQVATFHRKWTDSIEVHPVSGRSFALYQDLSSAFVLGRRLPRLPKRTESPGWDPAKVAQQLMLRCL